MSCVRWLEPAPLWEGKELDQSSRPSLLKIDSDQFLPEFLEAMAVSRKPPPRSIEADARALPEADAPQPPNKYLTEHLIPALPQPGGTAPSEVKLYQPLHGSFYLVTASLICEQIGLPDKSVDRKSGESTSFVLRRIETPASATDPNIVPGLGWVEYGWVDKIGWVPLMEARRKLKRPIEALPNEERFPIHPVEVQTGPSDNAFFTPEIPATFGEGRFEPKERKVYYGYIATGNSEKYQEPIKDSKDPSKPSALAAYWNKEFAAPRQATFNGNFVAKVETPWRTLESSLAGLTASQRASRLDLVRDQSRTILIELCIYLSENLPLVWASISTQKDEDKQTIQGDDTALEAGSPELALFQLLNSTQVMRADSANTLTLGECIRLAPVVTYINDRLIRKKPAPTIPTPASLNLDLGSASSPNANRDTMLTNLHNAVSAAVKLGTVTKGEDIPADMRDIITKLAKPRRDNDERDKFVIRMVFDYDPDCPPIVSDPSAVFTFAKFFDVDAPARKVRIEMPSIKPKDLKRFSKGVGIQMSPKLNSLMEGMHKGVIDGEEPNTNSLDITMICTFSIQIVMIVALIVMFIFLIILNIVFQWMAFIRICIPVPTKT